MPKRVILVAAVAALLWAAGSGSGLAWNDTARRLLLVKAIDALPKPLKSFYEDNKASMSEAIGDPSRFGTRALFEVDKLEPFPFDNLPSDRTLAERKYGEDTLKETGDAPWKIVDSYKALVEAFKGGDFQKALGVSEDIAYYVGELYDPPNVSKNGDGEPTGQLGLRERFDSRLMEAFGDKIKLATPSAIFLDRPAEYAVSIPRKSYIFVDNILYFDYLSHKGVESYDRFYYEGMWLRAQPVIEQLLSGAALDAASFWYTAWVEAKKPDLPKK